MKNKIKIRHILILLFTLYVCSTLIKQQSMISDLKAERNTKKREVETLEQEISEINKEIKNSDSLEFVEKIARQELRMVKPREIIYIDKNKENNPFSKSKD